MTAFTLPTSRPVTQAWGAEFDDWDGDGRVDYPGGFYHSIGWLGHNGIDYGCFIGDPVEAVCDGVIEYVGPGNNHPLLTGGGNTILLRNDELGMRFEYLHLSQQNVYTGQRVKVGNVIGLSGNSGAATAPHLHLGAIPVGNVNQNDGWRGRVDPTPYLYGAMNPDYAGSGLAAQAGTITPLEEDDMPYSEDDIRRLVKEGVDDYAMNVRRFPDGRNLMDQLIQMRQEIGGAAAAAKAVAGQVLYDNRVDGRNLFDWFKQLRSEISGIKPGQVDIPGLAMALSQQLAAADVKALADQLQITVKAGK